MWMRYSEFVEVVHMGKAKYDRRQEYYGCVGCLGQKQKGDRGRAEKDFFCYGALEGNIRRVGGASKDERTATKLRQPIQLLIEALSPRSRTQSCHRPSTTPPSNSGPRNRMTVNPRPLKASTTPMGK